MKGQAIFQLSLFLGVITTIIIVAKIINRSGGVQKLPAPLRRWKKLDIVVPKGQKEEVFTYMDPLTLKGKKNKARIIAGNCLPEENSDVPDKFQMTLVTVYFPVDTLRDKHYIYDGRIATIEEGKARIFEIISTFQENLDKPYVKNIYIFVEHYSSMEFLRKVDFKNSEKIVIYWTNSSNPITMGSQLLYASKCLQGQIVNIINQDIVLGDGFDKIDAKALVEKKIMYALTRQLPKSNCEHTKHSAYCIAKYNFGSHDAFMFHVKRYPKTVWNDVMVAGSDYGMENVMVWLFRNKLGYKVLNPCLVLHIHHHHCVPIRVKHRPRVNTKYSDMALITSSLT